ncbi:MAG: acyl-CoA thioesterase [Acidimicrobiia bacterium]
MSWPVEYRRKVRYSDTDAQGIVFNGNYFTYMDDALTDWLDATGLGGGGLVERGFDIVLAHAEVDFRSSARLGDTLVTAPRVAAVGRTSVTFTVEVRDEETGRLVVEASQIQVLVDAETFRPAPVPAFFVEAASRLQGAIGD